MSVSAPPASRGGPGWKPGIRRTAPSLTEQNPGLGGGFWEGGTPCPTAMTVLPTSPFPRPLTWLAADSAWAPGGLNPLCDSGPRTMFSAAQPRPTRTFRTDFVESQRKETQGVEVTTKVEISAPAFSPPERVCLQPLGISGPAPRGACLLFSGFLPVSSQRPEKWVEWWPPQRYVHVLIPRTCECYLIWKKVFADAIK